MASSSSSPQASTKARPQSVMAMDFSAALDDLFQIDSNLDELARTVERKRQSTTLLSFELDSLNSRLRATEQRLKHVKRQSVSFSANNNPLAASADSEGRDMPLPVRNRWRESDSNQSQSSEASRSTSASDDSEVKETE